MYGEPNNPEKDHVYKKIDNTRSLNIHDSSKSIRGVYLPRIPSGEERAPKHKNSVKKIRKQSRGVASSSEPGSSESGGSDTDIAPMFHAFHHLRSGSNSSNSSQDGDSDSSTEDTTENQQGNDGRISREGKQHVKVVAWTADDQKNIIKIGCLEIERNQRLETLIARRRARKYADRNLVEFGSTESLPTIEELSKFNVQIPAVFAPRKNPFDLPYNEDNFPDSAPSALLETRYPFDLPSEQANESSSYGGANSSHDEPIPVACHLQSALLRRHESFTEGAPFLSDFLQDTQPSRFRPYFMTEKMANEEMTDPVLEGETSEKSNSKASSAQDSDSTSSVADQESQKDVLEDCSNQGQQSSFSQTEEHAHIARHAREVSLSLDMEPPVLISDSSDDDISLSGEHINDWEEAQQSENFSLSQNTWQEDPNVMQHHQEIDITSNGLNQMSPHSNDLELTSSSTETTDDPFEVNDIEPPAKEVVVVDDTHVVDPVYDSSPSGSERPAPTGLVIDGPVLKDGHACTLVVEAIIEEGGSSSRMEVSSSEVAGPSLSSVEQSESPEKEASEIREQSMVGHDEAHGGSVSHADPSVSDISSQPSTESSTNGDSGSGVTPSFTNAVL